MVRYFTLEQAQRLLPEAERQLRRAMDAHRRNQKAEAELAAVAKKVSEAGGLRLDPQRMLALKNERETALQTLKDALETITGFGIQVKDLEMGLIDFPTLYRGTEVLLCWKLGETSIAFWHGLEDGFRGRKRIDREFIDNHRGAESQ